MERRRFLLALVISWALFMTVCPGLPAMADSQACGAWGGASGDCGGKAGAAVGDGGVDVSVDWESVTPGRGSGATPGGGGNPGGDPGDGLPDGVSWVPGGVAVDQGDASAGPGVPPRRGAVTAPAVPAAPACAPQTPCDPGLVVRVSDLVSIPADAPTQGMEPDGWTVVGTPTNFFATASVHVRSGPLLGVPADVRYTPTGFRWDYGDGTSRGPISGGVSWAALNLPEFSETATSHVFNEPGTLTIGLRVLYSAEYRFGGADWRPVQGLLLVQANPITAIAERAGTVLVAHSCADNPRGPGC